MENDAATEKECMFRWPNIVAMFESFFQDAFRTNKKAHFDNVTDEFKVVDGAKAKWCNLLLLDAIIYILRNNSMSSSTRRTFNQHRVLYECIIEELKGIDSVAFVEITEEINKRSCGHGVETQLQTKAEKYTHLRVRELDYPWDSMSHLCGALLDTPPSKAKNKYVNMVHILSTHTNLAPFAKNLNTLIQVVICRVLFVLADSKVLTPEYKVNQSKRQAKSPGQHTEENEGDDSPFTEYELSSSSTSNGNTPSSSSKSGEFSVKTNHQFGTGFQSNFSGFLHGSSPIAKHKRAQGPNNSAKKRPSLEHKHLSALIHDNMTADAFGSPVAKNGPEPFFGQPLHTHSASCHMRCVGSPSCGFIASDIMYTPQGQQNTCNRGCDGPICKCGKNIIRSQSDPLHGNEDRSNYQARLSQKYPNYPGPIETSSSARMFATASPLMMHAPAALPVHPVSSVATHNMVQYSRSPRQHTIASAIQLPPLFIPTQVSRYEQDVREQPDLRSGLTPTIADLSIHQQSQQQQSSSSPARDKERMSSPSCHVDLPKPPSGYGLFSPLSSFGQSSIKGCAESMSDFTAMAETMMESHSYDDLDLSAEECDLLIECTLPTPRTPMRVSTAVTNEQAAEGSFVERNFAVGENDLDDNVSMFDFGSTTDLLLFEELAQKKESEQTEKHFETVQPRKHQQNALSSYYVDHAMQQQQQHDRDEHDREKSGHMSLFSHYMTCAPDQRAANPYTLQQNAYSGGTQQTEQPMKRSHQSPPSSKQSARNDHKFQQQHQHRQMHTHRVHDDNQQQQQHHYHQQQHQPHQQQFHHEPMSYEQHEQHMTQQKQSQYLSYLQQFQQMNGNKQQHYNAHKSSPLSGTSSTSTTTTHESLSRRSMSIDHYDMSARTSQTTPPSGGMRGSFDSGEAWTLSATDSGSMSSNSSHKVTSSNNGMQQGQQNTHLMSSLAYRQRSMSHDSCEY